MYILYIYTYIYITNLYMTNLYNIYIYPNQVGLAHYSCSTINPSQASSLIIQKLTSSFPQTNVVECNLSKVANQVLASFQIVTFLHVLFACTFCILCQQKPMVWFLYKAINGLKCFDTTAKIHKFPDISCHKIPDSLLHVLEVCQLGKKPQILA